MIEQKHKKNITMPYNLSEKYTIHPHTFVRDVGASKPGPFRATDATQEEIQALFKAYMTIQTKEMEEQYEGAPTIETVEEINRTDTPDVIEVFLLDSLREQTKDVPADNPSANTEDLVNHWFDVRVVN